MDFKIGDLVRGINDTYSITNRDMFKGEILDVRVTDWGDSGILIHILEHKNKRYINKRYWASSPNERFEIIKEHDIQQSSQEAVNSLLFA